MRNPGTKRSRIGGQYVAGGMIFYSTRMVNVLRNFPVHIHRTKLNRTPEFANFSTRV